MKSAISPAETLSSPARWRDLKSSSKGIRPTRASIAPYKALICTSEDRFQPRRTKADSSAIFLHLCSGPTVWPADSLLVDLNAGPRRRTRLSARFRLRRRLTAEDAAFCFSRRAPLPPWKQATQPGGVPQNVDLVRRRALLRHERGRVEERLRMPWRSDRRYPSSALLRHRFHPRNRRRSAESETTMRTVNVICDRVSGKSRGFGFVKFAERDEAERALREMDGQRLDGRSIRVEPAKNTELDDASERS